MLQVIPQCPKCVAAEQVPTNNDDDDDDDDDDGQEVLTVMKPDIVFFGEGLPDAFHHTLEQDKLSVYYTYGGAIHTHNK